MLPLPVGSVTVAPRQSDGRLAGYGPTPDHWLTGALLAQLRRLSGPVGGDRLDLDTALDDILTAAVDAAADPLRGYSADEIVVGPGGQTLAEAAAAAPELEPGWEDRTVERARRDGVLPTQNVHNPTRLADFEQLLTELLASPVLSADARAAALSMTARRVREAAWHDRAAGAKLAARIESHVDAAADQLRGLAELARSGRLELR